MQFKNIFSELYVAIYDYVSDELGDLTFSQGEIINVTMSDGEWWSGTLDGRSGIFPANFVKKTEKQPATPAAPKEMEVNMTNNFVFIYFSHTF